MDNEFYTLLTDRGMAKIASALADKKQLHLQKMAVGDGGGQYYEPTASQTKLRHEVWRGEMNTLTVAPNNPNWLIAELVLPEEIGGWYVREVGVFDADGELIAIGKFPESYKPLLPGGCGKQVCIRLIMEVSNTTAVTLTVDPSIVLATRDYVDARLDEHEHSTNHPDATLTQKGFTQLSNATDSDDETKAATPKAVKAAMDKANAAAPANHTHAWNQITGVPDGTLTQKGIVKLNNATDSTSTTEAATPSAVKAAYDKASEAYNRINNSSFRFYTSNGIFTVPDGVTEVLVEMSGGGGGGGGGAISGSSTTFSPKYGLGGGAGSPGTTIIDVVRVNPGERYNLTVGAGGAGGAGGTQYIPTSGDAYIRNDAIGQAGGPGGASLFASMTAFGGSGGRGGQVIITDFNTPQGMVPTTYSANGGNALNPSFGFGGSGGINSNGQPGSGHGAGGGGGAGLGEAHYNHIAFNGGSGSGGFIKISW
ncbi:phage tail protein [Salmonella enterica]|nr:phage tail protein [Salmonella enterica subsp. enterica serovar Afula]EJX6616024.1 phage tail protein [Salmonella enterica]